MKMFLALYVGIILSISAFAQTPAPSASPAPVAVAPSPTPVAAPIAAVTGPEPVPAIVKDESMAPPVWMQDVVVSAKKLPIVGPYVVKIGQIIIVLLTILTALTSAFVAVLAALKGVSSAAGLSSLYDKVTAFQNSKFMFWMKYASLAFNAQKPAGSDQQKPAVA